MEEMNSTLHIIAGILWIILGMTVIHTCATITKK